MTRQPVATVTRRTTGETATFAIRDLSAGDARLVGPLQLFDGERIEVRIELEAAFVLAADVVRFEPQRHLAHVRFRDVTPDVLAQIERSIAELVATVRAESPATVLVIHPRVEVSSALERDLAKINIAARVCADLARAIEALDDPTIRYIAAVVAGPDIGAILQHLEEHHAQLRRVTLFGDQIEKIDHPAASRVHAVLRTPWHFKGLARALDVPMESVVTTYDQLVALQVDKD